MSDFKIKPPKRPEPKPVPQTGLPCPLSLCDGSGFTRPKPGHNAFCECKPYNWANQSLGLLSHFAALSESPFEPLLGENLLIHGRMPVVGAHARRAVFVANDKRYRAAQGYYMKPFPFSLTTDHALLEASFSDMPDKFTGEKKVRVDLHDLIGTKFDLVILRIGRSGNRHKSLPGIVWERLQIRLDAGKPTWVVTERPWDEQHLAWSPELAELFGDHMGTTDYMGEMPEVRP